MSKGKKKKNIQIYGKLLCIHSKNKTNFLSSHFHFVRFTGTRIVSSEIQVWERIYTPRFINSFPSIFNRNKRNQNSQAPLTNFQTTGSNRDAANWGKKRKMRRIATVLYIYRYRPGNIFVWPIYFKSETSASLTFFSHSESSSCCTHVLVFACKSLTAALSLLTGLINQTVLPCLLDKSLFVHPSQAKSAVAHNRRATKKRHFSDFPFTFKDLLDSPRILSVTFLNGEQFLFTNWIILLAEFRILTITIPSTYFNFSEERKVLSNFNDKMNF